MNGEVKFPVSQTFLSASQASRQAALLTIIVWERAQLSLGG